MRGITRTPFSSVFYLRMCFLFYVILVITSPFSLAEINKHNRSKMTYAKVGSDSIKNSKKSAISSHQHENNKVDGGRNYSTSKSAIISHEKNSAAVNRFVEDVLKAQNDLKWIDLPTRHVNRTPRLDEYSPLAYTNQYSTVSVNVEDVLGRADIGYGSRLRGKRSFDRNYGTMWMLQKKKYGEESTRDVPQRVYLDNDMTFKRDADDADHNVLYRFPGMLDRTVYERGAMVNQPLKDWTRKKDLHSSGDWSNFNENFEVTNGKDSNKDDEKLHIDVDTQNQPEIVSLYDSIRTNDFAAFRESPTAIKNKKSQNTPLSLQSLKKTVLELRNNLTLSTKKGNIISRGKSYWWDDPTSETEIFDFDRVLDDRPDEKLMWRIKRAKNIDSEDENNSRTLQDVEFGRSYFGKHNLKESHDRSRRNRRSFIADLNYINNQTNISKNENHQKAKVINDNLGNATKTQKNEGIVIKLYSNYLNDGRNLGNTSNKMNISNSKYSLSGESFLKSIDHTATNFTNSCDFKKNFPVSSIFADSMRLSTNNDTDDSQKFAKDRSGKEKLGVAVRKISRFGIDDGQSKGAGEEFPRGNTSRDIGTATNESRSCVVEITVAARRGEIEANGTRKENREPIPGVIKVFEPRGRLYQKRETESATRLFRRTGEDETSAEKMRIGVLDESRNANARQDFLTTPIGLIIVTTTILKTASTNMSDTESILKDRCEDFVSTIVNNDLRKQQQMVPFVNAENRNANKSNGNSDTDRINIRVLGSHGNETMNVKEGTQTIMEADEYHEHDNNLRRKLLWISVDAETEDSLIESAKSVLNTKTESNIENVTNKDRQTNKNLQPIITIVSSNSSKLLTRAKREDNIEKNSILQNTLNSQISDTNHYSRHKRSTSFENLELNNGVNPRNVAVEKEVALNSDKKEENNEESLNQNVEGFKGYYNNREENVIEDNDKTMENKRRERFLHRRINPVRAKVDMLIRQKLDMRNKKIGDYRRKRHSMLDMIEYYDYNDEEQEHDTPINEQEIKSKNDKLSFEDKAEIKRDSKTTADLGKKYNENAEAIKKQEQARAQAKHKEPKEEIIVDLGERRNKTVKNNQNDKKPSNSSKSSFEDAFNEEGQSLTKENLKKIRQSGGFVSNVYHKEPAVVRSKWLDQPFENKIQTRIHELGDRYYYQQKDRRHPNNVEPLYEELKNVYDWPIGELKSGPRLRGDQRLRYESDDKLDTNPSELQPLNDRFFDSSQNYDAQRFHSANASWTSLNNIPASNYFALKVTDDMFKGGLEQSSPIEKNLPNKFSITTTKSKIINNRKTPSSEESAIEQSVIDSDSGSPYKNRDYIKCETRKVLKRNLNSEKQAAISSQDLDESFVGSLDWYDDFDDNVKVRFGRGLKAIDEAVISVTNKTYDQDNKSDVTNIKTNIDSRFHDFPLIFHDNSSISNQDWYNNTTSNLINTFNVYHNVSDQNIKKVQRSILMNTINMDDVEDLEAAEQKYVNNQTPRIKRAVASHHMFYDMNHNQHDSNEADIYQDSRFQLPNVLEDQSDRIYHGYGTLNWNKDIQDLDQYLKIPRDTNSIKKMKSRKKNKKNKHSLEKHERKKSSSHSSLSRNRRHRIHQSDISKNANRGNWKPKKKEKAEATSSTGRARSQKSKTVGQGLLRAGVNEASDEKMFYENAEDQSTVNPEKDDARRKEITLLLAADNLDDESQMDVALHGELAGKIVEQIFEQVKKNDQLKSVFGPGLQRNYKTEDVIKTGNIYRQGLDEERTNHTKTMMKKVTELLDKLILNEVQRKTCVFLSSDMQQFLGWMLGVDQEQELSKDAPLLPLVRKEIIPEQSSRDKFLFDSTSEQEGEKDISDLQKKLRVLETLVKEYNTLSTKEKMKVQTVHDYLVRQLNLLLRYIEAREAAEAKNKSTSVTTGAARAGTGNIMQYPNAVSNTSNASFPTTKDAFSSPIDMNNFFRFNNASFKVADRQFHDSHVAPHHREVRSLDKVPSNQHLKTKRYKISNNKKNKNHEKPKHQHRKHHKYEVRKGSLAEYKKFQEKRANLEENGQNSLYLGYEEPTIYNSFDLLDAKLTEKKKKRKRELADKENVATENDRMLDLLPIKGKNRLEDEVILLNKREAWKRENEEQLEEVAFGKDMRNTTKREKKRFEKLTGGDKRKPIDETSSRTKRENIIRETSTIRSTDKSNKSHILSKIDNGKSRRNLKSKNDNDDNSTSSEDKLRLIERRINVFVDNKTRAAIDVAVAEVSTGEKLAINVGANNQVKGKLGAINRETKIDKIDGSTSFVNLTNDVKPRVSKEHRKVLEAGKETDDNAVKLNRTTNYQNEKIDFEMELKDLRQGQEKNGYGVADWNMTDLFYDDDNLSRNKLREKYIAKLDELGDPNTDSENNLEPLRLRNSKWSNDVVGWKLLPIIKRSPYYDDRALSKSHLTRKDIPTLSNIINAQIEPNAYLNSLKLGELKYSRRRNDFNISPMLRIIDDDDSFSRTIYPKVRRVSEIAGFKDFRIHPKIHFKARKLSRLSNNEGLNSVAEFTVPFTLKDSNHKFSEISQSRSDKEFGDRMIYDGVGLQLPVWSYQYYDDFLDSSFHFVPHILRRSGDVHRYPTGAYLEYGPFKERARDPSRRIARRNRFRLRTLEEEAADFPGNNLANKSLKSGFACGKFCVETDKPVLASDGYDFVTSETKYIPQMRKSNKTKIKLKV